MQAIRQLGQWLAVLAVGIMIGWMIRGGATPHKERGYPERICIQCPSGNKSGKILAYHDLVVVCANEDGDLVSVTSYEPDVLASPMWRIELSWGHSQRMVLLAEPDPASRASRE